MHKIFLELDKKLRKASIAQVGGFRPPEDRLTSWFGGPIDSLPNESIPSYQGEEMFQLLQVKIDELPIFPPELKNTKFLTVFFNNQDYPYEKPSGDGWLIREYDSLDGLQIVKQTDFQVKDFPIQWSLVADDAPDWENAWELVDLTEVNEDEALSDEFYERYKGYKNTKFGGFPYCIQHGIPLKNYIFQIDSDEKANWWWGDAGTAYFFKDREGNWNWDMQCY